MKDRDNRMTQLASRNSVECAVATEIPHVVIVAGGKGVPTAALHHRGSPASGAHRRSVLDSRDRHAAVGRFGDQEGHAGDRSSWSPSSAAYVGDGSQWGVEVDYGRRAVAAGTVGPALMVLDRLPIIFS